MKVSRVVLLIEESLENRENFTEMLKLFGYSVLSGSNSTEGFQKAIEQQPDIIICNLRGQSNCKCVDTQALLSIHQKTKHIPIIITTTNNTSQFKDSCNKNGAEGFLLKPFSMEMMVDMVNEIILETSVESINVA